MLRKESVFGRSQMICYLTWNLDMAFSIIMFGKSLQCVGAPKETLQATSQFPESKLYAHKQGINMWLKGSATFRDVAWSVYGIPTVHGNNSRNMEIHSFLGWLPHFQVDGFEET